MEVLTLLGIAALLTRVGLAMYATGLSRSKNSGSGVTRAVCDLCFVLLAFWALGAAILWQMASSVLGLSVRHLLGGSTQPAQLFFQAAAILTATPIVAAALAERSRFFPSAAASVLLGAILLPVAGNWSWYGWLRNLGFIDVAGAASLHLTAGICAVVGAAVIGPRTGKFNKDGSTNTIPGHNLPLASVGVILTLVGWIPYVVGSVILHSFENGPESANTAGSAAAADVLFAAAGAGAAALLYGQLRYRKPDLMLTLAGILGGLVAVSAGAGVVGSRAAVLIGMVAGFIVPAASVEMELRARLDDAGGLIAVCLVGGVWGTLAAGFFAGTTFVSRLKLVGVQIVGVISLAALAAVLSTLLFLVLRATVKLRVREAEEFEGLDLAEHDIGAYPDFQQNMIKSYHLRET